jgi:predicted nucleic acid-binding protein
MSKDSESRVTRIPRVVVFLAGVAAGAVTLTRRRSATGSAEVQELKASVARLEERVAAHESAQAERNVLVESRLNEQAAKLAEVPSTAQIVAAMEQLLGKTMASLDERLSTQAQSIEVLRATVSQTDGLLERVLESLDSLNTEPLAPGEDSILHPTV